MYVHYRIVFILTTILLSLQTSVIIALTQKSTFTFLSYTFTLIWKSLYPLHWWLCWDRQTVPLSPARGQTRSSSRNSQTGLLPCATQKLLWALKCLKCLLSQDLKTKKGSSKFSPSLGLPINSANQNQNLSQKAKSDQTLDQKTVTINYIYADWRLLWVFEYLKPN